MPEIFSILGGIQYSLSGSTPEITRLCDAVCDDSPGGSNARVLTRHHRFSCKIFVKFIIYLNFNVKFSKNFKAWNISFVTKEVRRAIKLAKKGKAGGIVSEMVKWR